MKLHAFARCTFFALRPSGWWAGYTASHERFSLVSACRVVSIVDEYTAVSCFAFSREEGERTAIHTYEIVKRRVWARRGRFSPFCL